MFSAGIYAAKHNPFVFFRDVAGDPPSSNNRYCAAHTRSYDSLARDLATGDVANYVFITPSLCHDMHGQFGCPDGDFIGAGDRWLARELPPLVAWSIAHSGVILLTWDQGSASILTLDRRNATQFAPFIAIGSGVRKGPAKGAYDHGSIVKSIEKIFGLPILPSVRQDKDLSGLFQAGQFP